MGDTCGTRARTGDIGRKAVAQRVEITPEGGLRISGRKVELLRTISANNGVEAAALDVHTREPAWRHLLNMRENYFYDIAPVRTPRRDKGGKRGARKRLGVISLD